MLYILDSNLRRSEIIDQYISIIWTERFSAFGDFQIVLTSNGENRARFSLGTWINIKDSTRIMKVETIEDSQDSEGRSLLTITGRSSEILLEDRVTLFPMIDPGTSPPWIFTGTPGNVIRAIFDGVCGIGAINTGDQLPFLTSGSIYPSDTLPEPEETISVEVGTDSLYSVIKSLCDAYDLGFRIVRGPNGSELYFNIYSGNDRTSAQSSVAAVVFSPDLDNLSNVTELNSTAGYKNVAYVFTSGLVVLIVTSDAELNPIGFDRRVLLVDTGTPPEFTGTAPEISEQVLAFRQKRGLEELAKNRKLTAFDGEVPETSKYKYGVDYQLGDMIEMRNADGATKNVRVSEQIFVSDAEGIRSYPTLTDILFITPGSWLAWDYGQVWDDAIGYWDDQP